MKLTLAEYAAIAALIDYDPITGVFRWKVTVSGRAKAGDIAGSISKKSGYLQIRIKGKLFYGHHLAWFLTYQQWPGRLDHRNRDRSANWIANLRPATQAENNKNTPIRKTNASGFKGVSLHDCGKYRAQIFNDNKAVHIGLFDTAEQAAAAYDLKAIELHKAFAMTNQMMGLI